MARSPFALVSLIAGILLLVPALFIAVIDGLGLPESHPIVVIGFVVVAVTTVFEAPIQLWNSSPAFPVILPLIAVVCGMVSFKRAEPRTGWAKTGIAFAIVSLAVHAAIKLFVA